MQRFGVGGFVFVLDTREATNRSNLAGGSRSISIHASAWEATISFFLHLRTLEYFNSRLRVGGDSKCTQI